MDRQFSFRCHPWDIEDESVDAALGRLAGDLGIDTLTITATHPEAFQIRTRPLGGRWTFDCAAAAHFQPDSVRHGSSRIRPHAAAWLKNRNPLERIAKVAERERLRLRVRVSCLKGEALVSRNAHAACVNVFGDVSREWLCASHPDVREYVTNLIDDLWTNYGLEAVELEDLDARDERGLFAFGATLNQVAGHVASTCFCASCRQRAADASLNLDSVRSALIERWQRTVDGLVSNESDSAPEETLASSARVRSAAVSSLLQSIRERSTVGLRYIQPSLPTLVSEAAAQGAGVSIIPVDSSKWTAASTAMTDSSNEREALIPTHPGAFRDGPALVALVHQLAGSGCAAIQFDHYGVTSESGFESVRQAVRYARRESGG